MIHLRQDNFREDEIDNKDGHEWRKRLEEREKRDLHDACFRGSGLLVVGGRGAVSFTLLSGLRGPAFEPEVPDRKHHGRAKQAESRCGERRRSEKRHRNRVLDCRCTG